LKADSRIGFDDIAHSRVYDFDVEIIAEQGKTISLGGGVTATSQPM